MDDSFEESEFMIESVQQELADLRKAENELKIKLRK